MEIYLPIAEMSVHWLIILGMGAAIGFLSGLFGVGGGFLLTPLLIFYGVPASVAVATSASRSTIRSPQRPRRAARGPYAPPTTRRA